MNGSAENIAVGWAPTHAHWPQLSPQSEGMAILGAFLGGRSEAGRLAVQLTPRPRGLGQWVEAWQAVVCDLLPDFQQFLRQ